jgi:hypothetical protein
MAKRSRGAVRPGQTRPTRRPQRPAGRLGPAAATDAIRTSPTRPVVDDTSAEDAGLEPPEARAAARGRQRVEPVAPTRVRSGQASGLLAARAAEEYDYVVRDVRRIGRIGGSLFLLLLALFLLIEVAHVITL